MIRRSTWVVLAIFALLLGAALYLQTRPAQEANDSTPTPTQETSLFSVDASQLVGVRIIGPDGRAFYVTRQADGGWLLIEPATNAVLDSGLVESNLNQLLSAQYLTRLDATLALESVGLVTPQYIIRFSLSDGQQRLFEIGSETPTASGYYVRLDNTELVVVSKFNIQAVVGMLQNLPLVPTATPQVTPTPAGSTGGDSPGSSSSATSTPEP